MYRKFIGKYIYNNLHIENKFAKKDIIDDIVKLSFIDNNNITNKHLILNIVKLNLIVYIVKLNLVMNINNLFENKDITNILEKSKKKKWDKNIQDQFNRELDKLINTNPNMPEYTILKNYLDYMLDLP